MKQAVRITFIYLIIVAAIGLYLRAMPFLPWQGLAFDKLRHAHSHLAFLGWVYSALFLGFVHFFLPAGSFSKPRFRQLFWWTQGSVIAMTVAFAIAGYGGVSIGLLILHTLFAFIFIGTFLKEWKFNKYAPSDWFVITAFTCFFLSSLGPLAIPVIQFGLNDSMKWMKYAIHFYLYFQYSGWFVFGILAILLRVVELDGVKLPVKKMAWAWLAMVIGMFPAYFLGTAAFSLLPAIAIAAFAGVVVQSFGLLSLVASILPYIKKTGFQGTLLSISLVSLILKNGFELVAATPIAYRVFDLGNHYLVLAYLHLILLGLVTVFICWMFYKMEPGQTYPRIAWTGLILFGIGWLGAEIYLFAFGLNFTLPRTAEALLIFSAILFAGLSLLAGAIICKPAFISINENDR